MRIEMIDKVTGRTIWANKAQEAFLLKIGRAEHVKNKALKADLDEDQEPVKKAAKKTAKKAAGKYKTRALRAEG